MTLKLNEKYIRPFVDEKELANIQSEISAAHKMLLDGSGEGSDFLGWIDLPTDYDKEEFARIKVAAEKINGIVLYFFTENLAENQTHNEKLKKRRKQTPAHSKDRSFIFLFEVSFYKFFKQKSVFFHFLKHISSPILLFFKTVFCNDFCNTL